MFKKSGIDLARSLGYLLRVWMHAFARSKVDPRALKVALANNEASVMMTPSPQSRNDDPASLRSSSGHSKQQLEQYTPIHNGQLPSTEISQAQLDDAKRLLTTEQFGVCYRDVLAEIAKSPWIFTNCINLDSIDLTKKLIPFNLAIDREYSQRCSSEGFFSRLLACVPIFGQALPSTQFLEDLRKINQIASDMKDVGLIKINYAGPDTVFIPDRPSPIYFGTCSSSILVSDLGILALQMSNALKKEDLDNGVFSDLSG